MRPLTPIEATVARAVVDLGSLRHREFAAYLATSSGPLIEIITRMRDDAADPSQDVLAQVGKGTIVVHHNHLTQESLSSADWAGLTDIFAEVFAHCADGTTYWGRVVDHASVARVRASYLDHEMTAANILFGMLRGGPSAADIGKFFAKEVINRAMGLQGFVEYEAAWGSGATQPYARAGEPTPVDPAGVLGSAISLHILAAAQLLAPSL